jgi:hypothetical protein
MEPTKVVPFGRKIAKKQTEDKPINWEASNEEEATYNKACTVIDAHTNIMIDLLAEYLKENDIINPKELTAGEFKDMVLIKEALSSLMFRVLGYEHELHHIVENLMEIPLPSQEELNEEGDS